MPSRKQISNGGIQWYKNEKMGKQEAKHPCNLRVPYFMLFTNHRWKLMCKSGWVLKLTSKRPHLQFLHFHLFTDSAHLWVPMLKYLCSYIVIMPSYNIDENHCHLVTAILALRNGVQIAHWSTISWCSKFESDFGA